MGLLGDRIHSFGPDGCKVWLVEAVVGLGERVVSDHVHGQRSKSMPKIDRFFSPLVSS